MPRPVDRTKCPHHHRNGGNCSRNWCCNTDSDVYQDCEKPTCDYCGEEIEDINEIRVNDTYDCLCESCAERMEEELVRMKDTTCMAVDYE